MANLENLALSYNFLVSTGSLEFGCSKITGVSNEIEVEKLYEGGVNDTVIFLASPRKATGTLVFEHGRGRIHALNQAFHPAVFGRYICDPGEIMVLNAEGETIRKYRYGRCIPVKWSLSNFDAGDGSILIDSIEIMHSGIYELPVTKKS